MTEDCGFLFACRCDEGFGGRHCVPRVQLPMMMRDDFNKPVDRSWWPEVYGGEVSRVCGTVVSDTALAFYKVGKFCRYEEFRILLKNICLSTFSTEFRHHQPEPSFAIELNNMLVFIFRL